MSFYNMVHGYTSMAPILLKILNLTPDNIPRFRDSYLQEGKIVVYTRTGGGNRDYYENEEECRRNYPEYFKEGSDDNPSAPWNDDLRAHPNYESDYDDDYDSTYASFYFTIPEEYKEFLAEAPEETLPKEKWEAVYEKLRNNNESS
jgi:hypothetical protein